MESGRWHWRTWPHTWSRSDFRSGSLPRRFSAGPLEGESSSAPRVIEDHEKGDAVIGRKALFGIGLGLYLVAFGMLAGVAL